MSDRKEIRPETLVAQANHTIDSQTGGVVPPIQPSTTYARDENYQLLNKAHEYSRDDNPTYQHAEAVLAQLEGGHESMLFASGMAGAASLLRTMTTGQRILAPSRMYHGVISWLKAFSARRGVQLDFYDPAEPQSLEHVIGGQLCDLVWVETPANPTWDVVDVERAAELAHNAGAVLAVDNTIGTPVHCNPISLGADFVLHSGTKFINGHSDVMAGVLIAKEPSELWERVKFERHYSGNILGPFEAWLLLRGMRTLFVRVNRSSATALRLAQHFERHPKIERVLYPGLESHPTHHIANKQMINGYGSMVSILVDGGWDAAIRVATSLELFIPATSLGGVESLVEHRKTVEGPESLTPDNLLRFSIGIEDADDLISDLEQALKWV